MGNRTVTTTLKVEANQAVAGMGRFTASVKESTKAGEEFGQRNKGSLTGVSDGMLKVGATAAVGLGIAIKSFATFDKQMSSVKAATQETAGNMELLRAAAMKAGKDTSFSATEAAKGIESLAKAGVTTQQILGGGLTGALDLAAAGTIDVGTAAEIAATAMTQFKLSGEDVPHIADLLAAGAGKAQGEVGDLAMALKQGGLVANQFGISVEETTGTLAAFASAGLIGSDAGTSFKTMLIALANPSKESAKAMRDLGITAYDAQGAFIGIAPLADQLKTRLSGLTEEQRNAALAQIFGNDALRAAGVLYDQGGDGIAKWTNAVNDQGFAAETARTKTDNLIGDVERLGGAFETALIGSGEGANGTLRGLVQTMDALVTGFAEAPKWVTNTVTGLVAFAAITGIVGGGLIKITTAALGARTAFLALGTGAKIAVASMGVIGIALTAAAIAYGVFTKRNEEAEAQAANLRTTLDSATGAITNNTRAFVSNQLAESGMADTAEKLHLNLSNVTDAALGNKAALDGIVTSLDAAIAKGTVHAQGNNRSATMLTAEARAAQALKESLIGTNAATGEAIEKQRQSTAGAKTNTSAQQQAAEAHKTAAAATQDQTVAIEDLISAMLKMPGMVLSLRDAQRGVEAAFDDATASIKENGRTLDITTPKGRANAAALDGIADAANDLTKSYISNGTSQATLQKHLDTSRARLVATGKQMGYSQKDAEAYAKSVLAIPDKALTTVTNTAPAAKAKAEAYKQMLLGVPAKKTTNFIANSGAAVAGANAVRNAVNNVPSTKTITYRQMLVGSIGAPQGLGVKVNADGSAPIGNLPSQATIKQGSGRGVYQWAEGETQREAFIPYAPAKRRRSESILSTVAGDFGYMLVKSFANGGFSNGQKLVDLQFLMAQLGRTFDPLEGINLAGANNTRTASGIDRNRALADFKRQQAAAIKAIKDQGAIQKTVDAQKARIQSLQDYKRLTKGSKENLAVDKELIAARKELERREANLDKAQKNRVKTAQNLNAAESRVKDATDKVADAIKAQADAQAELTQRREDAVALGKQVAESQKSGAGIGDLFGDSLSAKGLLSDLTGKAAEAGLFAGQLEMLGKAGLAKGLIDQVRSEGPTAGSALAAAILGGGKGYIAQLNQAQAILDAQANRIGAGAANQVYGKVIGSGAATMQGAAAAQRAQIVINQTNYVTNPDIIAQRTAAAVAFAGGGG